MNARRGLGAVLLFGLCVIAPSARAPTGAPVTAATVLSDVEIAASDSPANDPSNVDPQPPTTDSDPAAAPTADDPGTAEESPYDPAATPLVDVPYDPAAETAPPTPADADEPSPSVVIALDDDSA